MPKSRPENNIPVPRTEGLKPSICIASSGPVRELKCDYDNAKLVFSEEEGKTPPELFNSLQNSNFDMYVYLSEDYDFVDESSVYKLVDFMFGYGSELISAAYSDIVMNVKGRQALIRPQQSASKYVLNNFTMNIPFAVKKQAMPNFDTRFTNLFLHMGINDVFTKDLIVHCPHFCFALKDFPKSNPGIGKEMEILHGK